MSKAAFCEQICEMTSDHFNLTGIMSLPAELAAHKPWVLLPNAGLVHHVGPCRTSVSIARALARAGFASLRLDLSNLGDSCGRTGDTGSSDQARIIEELSAAIEFMHGVIGPAPVVVYGLCSGSQNGFKLAVENDAVVGLIGVDHFGFKNWSYYAVHYIRKIMNPAAWVHRIARMCRSESRYRQEVPDLGAGDFVWAYPPKEEVEAGYRVLVDRNVKMEYIYTGDWSGEYNHRQQFFLMHSKVDFKGLVTICFRPNMSHILAEPHAQRFVVDRVLQFVRAFNVATSRSVKSC